MLIGVIDETGAEPVSEKFWKISWEIAGYALTQCTQWGLEGMCQSYG
jgi:hypothetical protein